MPTRRALLASALAAAIRPPAVGAQTSSAPGPSATAAPTTVLELQRRTIEVNGKTRLGVRHYANPTAPPGIVTEVGKPFRVRVENHIDQPSLIHWHGLTPPWQQDGVPGISGPPIPAGGSADYDFPLRFGGTFGCTPIRDCRSSR